MIGDESLGEDNNVIADVDDVSDEDMQSFRRTAVQCAVDDDIGSLFS